MKLPEFVFITNKDLKEEGNELILHTAEQPHFVFRVFKFYSPDQMEQFAIKNNVLLDAEHVPGYNILICLAGTITDVKEKVVLGHNTPKEAKPILKNIITFYENERIHGNESRQKKYSRP